jgi:signal transduction histidine kinase
MWFVLFSVIMLVLLWTVQTVFLDTFYKEVRESQVEDCASSIQQNIDDNNITSLLENVAEQNDVTIYVYDTSTSVLKPLYSTDKSFMKIAFKQEQEQSESDTSSEKSTSESNDKKDDESDSDEKNSQKSFLVFNDEQLIKGSSAYTYYEKAQKEGGCCVDYIDSDSDSDQHTFLDSLRGTRPPMDKLNTQSMVYTSLFADDSSTDYMVIITSQISPVDSIVITIRYQLVAITVILVIIGIFLAIIASRKISKPITDTTALAHQLAEKNYDIEFKNTGYKEVTDLNNTLNYAAGELKKVDSLQRELIANISHDLRTPLTMITGYSEVMRDLPGENTPENVQIIIDEANRLNVLVSDLLDISKLQSGTTELNKEEFSLTILVKDMFERYNKLKEQDGYNFVFEYERDVVVNADLSKINQVIYNLINNAINYAGDDKTIVVRQIEKDDVVRIEIEDHGKGIDQEHLENIWDRYYKVDKEHRSSVVGTGLGLSIVKNVLDLHSAHYGVKSVVGEGSVFWFELEIFRG